MKIAAFRLLLGVLARLPLTWLRLAGRVLGRFPIGGRQRRVRDNLARAFPELAPRERARLARRNRQAMLTTLLEVGPLWGRSREWLVDHTKRAEGWSSVRAAMEARRGLLLIGGHLGHWEASSLYGGLHLPVSFLYKPPGSTDLDRALIERRSRFGGEFIATGSKSMRRALQRLRSGEAVGLLFDQLPRGGEFVEAPFFGREVPTMTLAWRLARRTGCEVVLGHLVRCDGGWQPRFQPLAGLADETDPVRAAARMNAALESEIRKFPEQYLWRYRRFDPVKRPARRDPVDEATRR